MTGVAAVRKASCPNTQTLHDKQPNTIGMTCDQLPWFGVLFHAPCTLCSVCQSVMVFQQWFQAGTACVTCAGTLCLSRDKGSFVGMSRLGRQASPIVWALLQQQLLQSSKLKSEDVHLNLRMLISA